MSVEALGDYRKHPESLLDYAESLWINELVYRSNNNLPLEDPIYLNLTMQKLCAESLIKELAMKPHFQKFGGHALSITMTPSSEPYMFIVGLTKA